MNFPNRSRTYVDNQTIFILGEGSNLTIGKVENTAGIIGVEGNGKLKINEYKGKDLYNHDNLTTTGGSIGTSGAGISNENHRKEGITRHTVIGNVEIGSATGSPINRDRSKTNETTRDDHSSTNVYVESQTIDYALHPAKFKEDVGIAVIEGSATVEGALKKIDNILRGDDNSDISQSEKRRYEEIKENIIRVKTAPDMKLIAEGDLSDPEVQKRLGIGGRFNPDDPNLPEKIKERISQVREQGQEINYFYDKVTGKIYINENADEDEIRAGIGREWGIRDEFYRGRTKPNGEGQEKGTVAGEIAYKEIEDRTKGKGDKKVNPYDFEYAQFDPDSEVTGDVLGKLYIDRVKYTPFYGRAESTLKNKCNNNIHCLSNLYGLGDSIKTDGKATGMKNKEEVIGASIDFGEAYVAGRMSIPLGAFEAFMFIKDHMIDKKPKNSEEAIKEVYLTAVAIIENRRMQAAHDIYVKEKTDLAIFEDGISSQKIKAYNAGRKLFGEKIMSEKEIRDKIWRLNNYMKTENPDYFLKPRRLETIKPYYKLPKILL